MGAAWLESLPRVVGECAERWGLRLGSPLPGNASYVTDAVLPDGTPAVLKVNPDEPDARHEPDALAWWDGDGAVRLLARDDERRALLVERCYPATRIWDLPEEEAEQIEADVAGRLARPAKPGLPIETLAAEAERWADELPRRWEALGRPFEASLLEIALDALRTLPGSQGPLTVAHQDLHGGNIVLSERGWLAIDAKPLLGEAEFGVVSLLRDRRTRSTGGPSTPRAVRRRLGALADALGLDRERMRGWAVAHALAWGVDEDGVLPEMIESARLLAR